MKDFLGRIDKGISIAEDAVSMASLVVISVLVILQVFLRYVMDTGILWADEIVSILMVVMVMFGAPAATRRFAHTALLVFIDMMPKRGKILVRAIIGLIALAFLGLFLYSAAKYALDSKGMVTTVLKIPMTYVYSILPVGAALAFYEYAKTIPVLIKQEMEKA